MDGKTTLVLFAVLIFAGCTDSGTQSTGKEILEITGFDVFPSDTVTAGETLIVRATIKNLADVDAEFKVGENGKEILYDYCESLYVLNKGGFEILTGGSMSGNSMKLSPGREATFQWNMKAPSEEKIGADMGLSHTCVFKTQVSYSTSALTTSYVYFASRNEIIQNTYTDKDMNLKGDSIASKGPVVARLSPSIPQPVPAKTGDSWTFYIQLFNMGDGIANVRDISVEGIDIGDCSIDEEKLKIYGQKSSSISCTSQTPEVTILTPKRYTIRILYDYISRKEMNIKVAAFEY